MGDITNKGLDEVYKDLLHTNNSNSGISTSIKQVTCGDGDLTSLYLSTQNAKIQPATDSTSNTVIYDANGNALVTVDSTNDLVKLGIGQHTANTQYAYFGVDYTHTASYDANTHYPISFITNSTSSNTTQDNVTFGTSTDPATTFTTADGTGTDGADLVPCLWLVPDNITIDAVYLFAGGDAASGDTINIHLLKFDIDKGAGAGKGDLSNGVVLAGGADIASLGYENVVYQTTAPEADPDVDAGQVVLATFESQGTNSNYGVSITVKYHIR